MRELAGRIEVIERDPLESERYVRKALGNVPLAVVGARVKEARVALGLSIRSLAADALVSKTSVVNLEQGRSCRPATLVKIAGSMGVHVERFIDAAPTPSEAQALVHRRENDQWLPLLSLASGPVEGLRRPLSSEERDRLRKSGHDPLMMAFRNVPLTAGFLVGIIELSSTSEPRRHLGREFVLVLRGTASIRVGSTIFALAEGESLYFEGEEEHTYGLPVDASGPASLLCFRIH